MNYIEQLEKAILYIEERLSEDIKVEEVAGAAGYSYYHFHRIFEAVVGETVGNYLRTRRLTRAANDLIYTGKRILDIAVEYRFESQEAFNRAFKKRFKVTPGTYRKNRIDVIVGGKKELSGPTLKHLQTGITIEPVVRKIEEVKIIGLRDMTTIRTNKIPEMWGRFNIRMEEIKNRKNRIRGYGICEVDKDYDVSKFNEDTEFTEIVGIEVDAFEEIPQGMVSKTLAGGRYAVFTHKGRMDTLRMTYDYIWGTWIPYSGYTLDMRDDFEFYDERFLGPDNDLSEMDIYIPIK
ncbi:MAG: AraC family transcriptional regulator [Clostridia bacterium]|nr:AraC family transcriptional regulator [Clostridia bacterium]